MKTELRLAGYYGVDGREIRAAAIPGSAGVKIEVVLPADRAKGIHAKVRSKTIPWSEIEIQGLPSSDQHEILIRVAVELAQAITQ